MDTSTVITGGSAGIGRAIALALAGSGRRLWIASRGDEARARTVAELRTLGARAEDLPLDVTDEESREAAVERLLATDGRLELVHSAGTVAVHDLRPDGSDGDPYRRLLEEHLHGPRLLNEALLDTLLERGGAIVNVASAAGLRAFPRTAAYVAAKHAMVGYTRAAALELEGTRAQIAAVCPYYVGSPMMERGIAALAAERGISPESARAEFGGRNPGGRWIDAEQVAEAVLELLGPGANGRIVVLDGGPPRPVGDPEIG